MSHDLWQLVGILWIKKKDETVTANIIQIVNFDYTCDTIMWTIMTKEDKVVNANCIEVLIIDGTCLDTLLSVGINYQVYVT